MTFNDDARGGGRASKRGRNTGLAVGGGGLGLIALVVIAQLLGVDLAGLVGGGTGASSDTAVEDCTTGAQANEDTECRVDFAASSIEGYWEKQLGDSYEPPGLVLFEQSVSTACGGATSAVGPFYCPGDQTVYLDVAFYDDLRTRFGADGGSLAQMYVVAHEWGHHIQNITGTMSQMQQGVTGPDSDSVRLELQADCYAGAWAGEASTIPDVNGVPFLEPITEAQVADALDAASAIGDDRIQEKMGGEVTPHTWSHGSSEQRQRWFTAGFESGAGSCDTFAVDGSRL